MLYTYAAGVNYLIINLLIARSPPILLQTPTQRVGDARYQLPHCFSNKGRSRPRPNQKSEEKVKSQKGLLYLRKINKEGRKDHCMGLGCTRARMYVPSRCSLEGALVYVGTSEYGVRIPSVHYRLSLITCISTLRLLYNLRDCRLPTFPAPLPPSLSTTGHIPLSLFCTPYLPHPPLQMLLFFRRSIRLLIAALRRPIRSNPNVRMQVDDGATLPSMTTPTHQTNRTLFFILSTSSPHRPALPYELILQILENPSRWLIYSHQSIPNPVLVSNAIGHQVLLRTAAFTVRSLALFRKVVFTFRSHDQGWSSYPADRGTFGNSWSWFEIAIENWTAQEDTSSPIERRRQQLQVNRHGISEAASYVHCLDRCHEFLTDLRVGDEILLIARAMFPGWVNHVEEANFEVWGVDDMEHLEEGDE